MAVKKMTLEEKLINQAKFGLFFADLKIGKNKAFELQQNGFEVLDSREVNYYPRTHIIRWENACIDCDNVDSLDEYSKEYSFAQRLWIIAKKSQEPPIH